MTSLWRAILLALISFQVVSGYISVISKNGHNQITVNGKPIDMNKANIREITSDYIIYQPVEEPDVLIYSPTNGAPLVIDANSTEVIMGGGNLNSYFIVNHDTPMTSSQKERFDKIMAILNRNMRKLNIETKKIRKRHD
ncbi:hypothetical protein O3M35_008635 [Rhynocoris fuscipes]|uniref:Uncharacterized protein n=1 Tax=Rhynocoris fuscipes TaxID=488301 RepID=A0AAW1D6Z8_9HEMI